MPIPNIFRISRNYSETNKNDDEEEEKEDNAPTAVAQPSSEPAAPATVETPTDASGTTAESKPAEEKSDSEGIKLLEILPWVLNLMN